MSSLKEMPEVSIYTDGACSGNPGPGGWGAVLLWGGRELEISGGEPHTTNNRMEMKAVTEALSRLKRPCRVTIYSDSALIVNAFQQGWIDGWKRRGWKKADKKPVENEQLWKEMLRAMEPHEVNWVKVKGHAGIPLNERVDKLAVEAAAKFK
jgi:ribonuclease HI